MKKHLFFFLLLPLITSCNDSNLESIDKEVVVGTTSSRLHFDNEDALRAIIENDSPNVGLRSSSQNQTNFISLMAKKVNNTRSATDSGDSGDITYYEALGYDTLVPNPNFAALLNINGELEVGNKIIKIKPEGTYLYESSFENKIEEFISSLSIEDINSSENEYIVFSDKVTLFKTFKEKENSYTLESEGDNSEVSDDYFDSLDDQNITTRATQSTSEPDYSTFQTFSADRGGIFGKLIQSIIGSTKASTINYSSKRRIRGSFYFYNYGVYSEIGVSGWTDKKNWIGWSKTESDELRVSWRNVVIKKTVADYYTQSWDALRKLNTSNPYNNNEVQYFPPKRITINNRNVYAITITVTDQYAKDFKNKIINQGSKAAFDWLRSQLKRPASEFENLEAAVVASRTEIYMVYNSEEVKKYNYKNYTHVFANSWMTVVAGWSSETGFNINGIGTNNITNANSYLKVLTNAFNEKKPELVSGEVTVCARLGNVWKGMKIVKK
ncbi:hypothetical protein CLV62_1438 [Dysgonomonas alginatilytica]|uniref:Thiol-activated cytolysin n=1 Tax=Dysgonomonas alginatilytica TaxID=1605892 RepID=A0A2V3PI06_9BACT|nr:hypothetical protein [Dysgonomonas alginatilytica]PXV58828.1 hypothetical protein CLV62_1438 [Dysgonomonas alginatilytica]